MKSLSFPVFECFLLLAFPIAVSAAEVSCTTCAGGDDSASCACEGKGSKCSCGGKGCRTGRCSKVHGCRAIEGNDHSFNCGVTGSYKYPVPPKYTYHWPGMFSQQQMTDYHSPWRFPPLRPYGEEAPIVDYRTTEKSEDDTPAFLGGKRAVSARPVGEPEQMSQKLMRQSR